LESSESASTHKPAERPNHVWSDDFVTDQTLDGRQLKPLTVVDAFTRECLSIDAERSLTAQDMVARLQQLSERRAAPDFIRSDNGPEIIAVAVREWPRDAGVKSLYIEPGSPWDAPNAKRSAVGLKTSC
jgi:transposase InsO family protein